MQIGIDTFAAAYTEESLSVSAADRLRGALLIGEADEVAEKILRHSEALGGISRLTFQMNAASLPQEKMLRAIETLGVRVAPAVRTARCTTG